MHYVDASKLLEQNIAAVTAQFNFWFDTCTWHRPSVLILDNFDKLLSAEVEVQVNFQSTSPDALTKISARGLLPLPPFDGGLLEHLLVQCSNCLSKFARHRFARYRRFDRIPPLVHQQLASIQRSCPCEGPEQGCSQRCTKKKFPEFNSRASSNLGI